MAKITIGIPVYNGETTIAECLSNVFSQSNSDCTILISDNASTDRSTQICEQFCSENQNIEYIRQPANIGPLSNFRFLLDQCNTEFFMWRADDDLSDSSYIETLVSLLEKNPRAQLAVGKVITQHGPNNFEQPSNFIACTDTERNQRVLKRFYNYHVSWFYGVWRTKNIKEIVDRVWTSYPFAYAGDHLTLLSPILDEAIVGSNDVCFTQRTFTPSKGNGLRGGISLDDRIKRLRTLTPAFHTCYNQEVLARDFSKDEVKALMRERSKFTRTKLRSSYGRIARLRLKKVCKNLAGIRTDI